MNFFGRKMPKKAKQGMVKIALLILGICVFVTMPLIATLGWFASNSTTGSTGMQVVVSAQDYDILIDRPAPGSEQFDPAAEDSDHNLLYPNISDLTGMLAGEGYSLSQTDTALSQALAFELINDSVGEGGDKNLMPGSHGRLEFYLRPQAGVDGTTVTISIEINGYRVQYDEENVASVVPLDDINTQPLLLGHILFFTGYDSVNNRYSGLITDGSFQYVMGLPNQKCEAPRNDCYKVTLYWEWPITYEEILGETSTTSPAVARKYPAELATYWANHRAYFFATNTNSNDATLLSDGYNDGDQMIADNVDFLLVKIW